MRRSFDLSQGPAENDTLGDSLKEGQRDMADQLEETVKLLVLVWHRAPALDDKSLKRKVDALVDSYLVGFGGDAASKRAELATVFSATAPATTTSDRIRALIERRDD